MTTSRPAPLPRHVRALLAEYRDAHELPAAASERIWSVVGAEDAPEPAFDPLEHETDARPRRSTVEGRRPRKRSGLAISGDREAVRSQRGNVRWLGWGTATLAAAAVLVLAWQLGGELAERRQASRTQDAAVMQGGGGSTQGRAGVGAGGHAKAREADSSPDASASPASPASPDSSAGPILAPDPSGSTLGSFALDPSRSASRATVPEVPRDSGTTSSRSEPPRSRLAAAAPEPTPAEPGSTLAIERELVARAWRALALGETAQALDVAAEHARRFPAGLLAPERAAIDTIARCRRGDADGPRHADAFHRAHPRSPLAERIDEACTPASKESTTP
jgi:hypothetical protein